MAIKHVTFREVPHFDKLTVKEAENVIYNKLLPACEAQNVYLSSEGNIVLFSQVYDDVTCDQDQIDVEYQPSKQSRSIFKIERIQRAFQAIPEALAKTRNYESDSYKLKHRIEWYQKEYLSNGHLIVAMLLRGYRGKFHGNSPNCDFKPNARYHLQDWKN